MGKKSKAFIDKIADFSGRLNGNFVRLHEMKTDLTKAMGTINSINDAVQNYCTAERQAGWAARGAKDFTAWMAIDPVLKSAYDKWNEATKAYSVLVNNVKDGMTQATKNLADLRTTTQEFDKFIQNKKSSKNPFKSKKSLPASEAYITLAKGSIADGDLSLAGFAIFMKTVTS